jgi:hypothetical protein
MACRQEEIGPVQVAIVRSSAIYCRSGREERPMFTDADVDVVSGRLRTWSEALGRLSDPELTRALLTALDSGDGRAFRELLELGERFGPATCVEIVETVTRFVHTGDYEATRVCTFVDRLRPKNPNTTSGRGYRLADGTVLWLTEAEWWALLDRAVADEKWRQANLDLLVAVGIMTCHFELVPTISRFDVSKTYHVCPPTTDPRERRR